MGERCVMGISYQFVRVVNNQDTSSFQIQLINSGCIKESGACELSARWPGSVMWINIRTVLPLQLA